MFNILSRVKNLFTSIGRAVGVLPPNDQFFIYNSARERIGVLQHQDSVQWYENYSSPGEVKVVARATPQNKEMLVDGNRLYNSGSDTSARICHTTIDETETGTFITARAKITSILLADRVVMATENITNYEAGMYSVYSKNRRALPIGIAAAEGYPDSSQTEITWNSVLEAEEKLAEASGLGFKVLFDPLSGTETFKVYKGVDRSKDTSPDYVGYFGTDVGNIQNVSIESGSTDFKNVAIVAGEGEGSARTVRTVALGNVTGENRRELYVDARDIQREYQQATFAGYDEKGQPIYTYETKTYTNAQYNALLDARGREKLAEHLKDFSITCDIVQNNIEFGTDYLLGDRMPVNLKDYGIKASAALSSANRIYEKEGKKVVALLNQFELEAS